MTTFLKAGDLTTIRDYPDVMTVEQLAEFLHIGRNTAYGMIANREIGYKRIGRSIRIPKTCVLDYINSSRYNVCK